MQTMNFESFGKRRTGRLITHRQHGDTCIGIVSASNPYGGHNFVAIEWQVDRPDWAGAWRHGNQCSLVVAASFLGKKAYRRCVRYAAEHGWRL